MERKPRLRTANKISCPYPLGEFPPGFARLVGEQIIYLLYTKQVVSLEGEEWERMFAAAIGAKWKRSNIGLDDIVLDNCAWGAKTVKSNNPWQSSAVRLISGRNSPFYSYGSSVGVDSDPHRLGEEVLKIWNARIESMRNQYPHTRRAVLIRSGDLLKLTIYETETVRYDPDLCQWRFNKNHNLEGWRGEEHMFTWQPHGSQFTIIERVPDKKLCLKLRNPGKMDGGAVLKMLGVDGSWIEVVNSGKDGK
jgi:hypothetical protein